MNGRAVWAITRKDLLAVRRSRSVVLPMAIVPLLLLVVVPAVLAFVAGQPEVAATTATELERLIANLPDDLRRELLGYDPRQRSVILAVVLLVAPLYLVVPLMVASVIAADSFAGEKERKTLEALLATPTTDEEVLAGKLLVAWLPAVAIGWAGLVLYAVAVNLAAWPVMGRVFVPNALWLVLALWVGPAVAGVGLGATVLVSARVSSTQEAFQVGGVVVLPIVLLVVGQASGVVFLDLRLALLLGLLLWFVAAALVWAGGRRFRRADLLERG